MININDIAPSFELIDQNNNLFCLDDLLGTKKVIYFYPKDSTPGCTIQACMFRDEMQEFEKLGVCIIGISMDSTKKHINFVNKNNLNFTLLSDPERVVINQYDVWKEKKLYGKVYMGIVRTSFILDEENRVIKIYDKVKPKTNAIEIKEFLKSYRKN